MAQPRQRDLGYARQRVNETTSTATATRSLVDSQSAKRQRSKKYYYITTLHFLEQQTTDNRQQTTVRAVAGTTELWNYGITELWINGTTEIELRFATPDYKTTSQRDNQQCGSHLQSCCLVDQQSAKQQRSPSEAKKTFALCLYISRFFPYFAQWLRIYYYLYLIGLHHKIKSNKHTQF